MQKNVEEINAVDKKYWLYGILKIKMITFRVFTVEANDTGKNGSKIIDEGCNWRYSIKILIF